MLVNNDVYAMLYFLDGLDGFLPLFPSNPAR